MLAPQTQPVSHLLLSFRPRQSRRHGSNCGPNSSSPKARGSTTPTPDWGSHPSEQGMRWQRSASHCTPVEQWRTCFCYFFPCHFALGSTLRHIDVSIHCGRSMFLSQTSWYTTYTYINLHPCKQYAADKLHQYTADNVSVPWTRTRSRTHFLYNYTLAKSIGAFRSSKSQPRPWTLNALENVSVIALILNKLYFCNTRHTGVIHDMSLAVATCDTTLIVTYLWQCEILRHRKFLSWWVTAFKTLRLLDPDASGGRSKEIAIRQKWRVLKKIPGPL